MIFGPYTLPDALEREGAGPLEQGGLLLGHGHTVFEYTRPGPLDWCSADGLLLLDDCHERALERSGLDDLGFWHSHPPGTPGEPSREDFESWQHIAQAMLEQQPQVEALLFPIITGGVMRVWTIDRSGIVKEVQREP